MREPRLALCLYRLLLRLYPAQFREDYEREILLVFRRQWVWHGSRAGALWYLATAGASILLSAPKEHFDMLTHDLHYALRAFLRNPWFTIVAVATLALGMGVNSALFSVVKSVILEDLPYAKPNQLVRLWIRNPKQGIDRDISNLPRLQDWRGARCFQDLAGFTGARLILTGGEEPVHLACVGPDIVLDEIARIDFAGSSWKKDLLRSKPIVNTVEGRILPVLANAIAAFRHAPEWGGVLAFNEFGLGTVVLKPAPWGIVPKGEWTDHEDRLAAEWLQRQGILVSVDVAGQAVQTAARDHPFHPVRTYLNSSQWDGIERVDRWLATYLGTEDTEYSRAVGSRWLISAVARVFRPGAKADCCLILEGPQGIRKSTALATIAGEYFTDELADLGSKDAAMQTRGVWIIELSELDNLSHAMSRTTDRFRPPYGMRLVESPRQCVFAGTVNHGTYLRDETGGRRFWPVVCRQIDVDALARDRDQLWAEAKVRFESGSVWWLDTSDLVQLAADQQEARYEGDPWEEVMAPWLENRESASVSEILQKCINKPQAQWTQTDKLRAARCLRAQGWVRYRERQGSRLEWRYRPVC